MHAKEYLCESFDLICFLANTPASTLYSPDFLLLSLLINVSDLLYFCLE